MPLKQARKPRLAMILYSAVDSGGAGGARVPPEFGDSEKGRNLNSAYRSFAITANTMALPVMEFQDQGYKICKIFA